MHHSINAIHLASSLSLVDEILYLCTFIYLGFYVAFNTVQVISRRVVGRAEETSTYSWSRFCTVNCRPTASNYWLSPLRPCREPNPGLRGGHSATMARIGQKETIDSFDNNHPNNHPNNGKLNISNCCCQLYSPHPLHILLRGCRI